MKYTTVQEWINEFGALGEKYMCIDEMTGEIYDDFHLTVDTCVWMGGDYFVTCISAQDDWICIQSKKFLDHFEDKKTAAEMRAECIMRLLNS